MCFNSSAPEDFGYTGGSSGVPLPTRKPSVVTSGESSILGTIWNGASNVFERIASIEMEKYETERLLDIREAEEQAKIARQKELAGTTTGLTTQQQIVGGTSLMAILLLGTAAVLIARR